MTTYEYRALRGLNHGLAILHEEMSHYLVPPMLEDAAGLLGDFTAMTEALSACRVQICAHENQSAHSRQEARNAAYLRAEEEAEQVEAERDDAMGQLLDLQDERRELQAQLSAKAADLRVNEVVVKQLEAEVKTPGGRLGRSSSPAQGCHFRSSRDAASATCDPLAGLGHVHFPDDFGSRAAPYLYCADASRDNQCTSHRCSSHRTSRGLSLRPADRAWRVYLSSTGRVHFVWEGLPRECRQSQPVPLSVPHLCAVATTWVPPRGPALSCCT